MKASPEELSPWQVKPISGALGARIEGLDLKTLDEGGFGRLCALLEQYLVLQIPGERLSADDLESLVGRFGPLFRHPEVAMLENNPAVLELIRHADDATVFGGAGWHADVTYQNPAASVSVLHAWEVPEVGADTLFASQIAAFETLSSPLQELLRGLRVIHSYRAPEGLEEVGLTALHPAVRKQAQSGREGLYLNTMFGSRFENWTREESLPLIEQLCRHATEPAFTCRLSWQNGDTVLWDNRWTLHLPIHDHAQGRRHMIRASALEEIS